MSDEALAFRIGGIVGALVISGAVFFSCVERIDVGNVGLKINLAGQNKGLESVTETSGYAFYNPLLSSIVEFPTSVQNIVWTRSLNEGKAVDESITFSSKEGVQINSDVVLKYHIMPSKAPHIYLKFKQVHLQDLSNTYIRNVVRNSLSQEASKMAVQDIYGPGKTLLMENVAIDLKSKLEEDGIMVDQLSLVGALRLPENVSLAINKSMEATQKAIQAENRVREIKAEADQAVEKAKGEAESIKLMAQANADSTLIQAQAQAKSNEILSKSLSPQLIQFREIDKWNGQLPWYTGASSAPFMTMNVGK